MVLLLGGPIRQYWVVLLYVCWELIATVGLTVADLLLNGTAQAVGPAQMATSRLYARFYWTNALIEDLLLLVLTTVLIYKVAARPSLGRLLGGLVLVMVVLPFMLFHPTFKPMPRVAWFNSTNQLLNFNRERRTGWRLCWRRRILIEISQHIAGAAGLHSRAFEHTLQIMTMVVVETARRRQPFGRLQLPSRELHRVRRA